MGLAVSARAGAEGTIERALAVLRSPDTLTVSVGTIFPLVLPYETGALGPFGPCVGASLGWRVNGHAKVVTSANAGMLFADGLRRYTGSLDVGLRVAPWRRGLWLGFGLGVTAFVEKIGVALPDRMASATDPGFMVTGDLRIGVDVGKWELALGYDHVLRTSPYYKLYDGDEELPFWGTFMVWTGRRL